MGLMDYKARFYLPYLNHFTQPDSIVPDPSNPQAWNRYSYALNNPIRYNDPSGHKACDDQDEKGNCIEDKLGKLLDYVKHKVVNDDWQVKKQFTALAAMNMIVKQAAYIYGNDWDGFFKATNYVFLGTYSNSPYTMAVAHKTQGFHGITFASNLGDSGFHDDFKQGGDNQVRHFWAAFATAANGRDVGRRGAINAQYGNFVHDVAEDWLPNPDCWCVHKDTTYSDYTLSIVGINLAEQVNDGAVSAPSGLPNLFNSTIGTFSSGYAGTDLRWLFNTPDE